MNAPRPEDFEWTGEYRDVTISDYWCPTVQDWSMCPGPCPDGTPHGPGRKSVERMRLMRLKGGPQ